MKNNFKLIIGILSCTLFMYSCSSSSEDDRGNWKERSVFDGVPRSGAVSFTIGNTGYMGTGYDGDDYLSDFWEYNIEGDYWSQKADFPGTPRSAASSFVIANKGYIGTGYDGDVELEDFWEYDPGANSWNQKANFGGGIRTAAVGFGVNNAGYIGTGYDGDNDRKDFWKYNAQTDEWNELVGFGGKKRRYATTFTINNKVYLATGTSNGVNNVDFWEFNPENETWIKKNDLDYEDDYNIARSNAVGGTINGLGYIICGYNFGALGTAWEYNPNNDTWEEITAIEASIRQDAIAFSNGTRAFVALGRTGGVYLDDNSELFPQEAYDDED